MTLITSISGIRGTIGGLPQDNFTPIDIVAFVSAYGAWIQESTEQASGKIVIGRDARISGEMVSALVANTLVAMGFTVINLQLATTPTVELAVVQEHADGGIILTASHNPKQWNALKLLNNKGEFLSDVAGKKILQIAESASVNFASVDNLGSVQQVSHYTNFHISHIVDLPLVNVEAIKKADFTVAIDCVNSVGGTIIPQLLQALGVSKVIPLYCEPNGDFPHNPEPLPEHLTEIAHLMKTTTADVGFVVDPDVDRLAIINEDGTMFGEEYTLVAIADYVLQHKPGNTVSNLSSTRALRTVTEHYNQQYFAAAVGEVNVVAKMKEVSAVIGGEGNGGIIYPESHYGRDALVGIALFLTHLATSNKTCSELRASYPQFYMSKNKITLTPSTNVDEVLTKIAQKYAHEQVNCIDGVKIDFAQEWVHLRKSNTEPIIRIYAESTSNNAAQKLAEMFIAEIEKITQ